MKYRSKDKTAGFGRELRVLFPKMHRCLVWFDGGLIEGAAWEPLADAYIRRLSPAEATVLLTEIDRVMTLVRQRDLDLDTLIEALGWNRRLVLGDTPEPFLVLAHIAGNLDAAA